MPPFGQRVKLLAVVVVALQGQYFYAHCYDRKLCRQWKREQPTRLSHTADVSN